MATSSVELPKSPTRVFWLLVGIGILAVLLAAGWRVATGAELEATGKEWSIKVTEAANKLDEARKQLSEEAQRMKAQAEEREQYWSTQLAAANAACPRAAAVEAPPPAPSQTSPLTQDALADVARTAEQARSVARDIGRIRLPRF